DHQMVHVSPSVDNLQSGDQIKVSAWDGQDKIAEEATTGSNELNLKIANPKLWTVDAPFLYDLKIAVLRNGKPLDEVKTYFAMRKISVQPDKNGIKRIALNDKFLFQFGPLDQGWWPDGLYTAPNEDALAFDIQKTRDLGYNVIRKHVKVGPARWYYHADRLGMLVWQDMPSGDNKGPDAEANYRRELQNVIGALRNH